MKRLLIDMDGVLADVYAQFMRYEKEEFGLTQEYATLTGKTEDEAFKNAHQYVRTKNFFADALPIPDSIEVVEKLNGSYNLFIVSSATEFPLSLTEKMLWLQKYFPFLGWKQVVLCGTKEIVSGDIMIDDHFKNLDPFKGKTFLFSQPHNELRDAKQHQRVSTWKEIEKILL